LCQPGLLYFIFSVFAYHTIYYPSESGAVGGKASSLIWRGSMVVYYWSNQALVRWRLLVSRVGSLSRFINARWRTPYDSSCLIHAIWPLKRYTC